MPTPSNRLVLKLSAFGDIVFALPAMLALAKHHHTHLHAITTPPYVALLAQLGIFAQVHAHRRFPMYRLDRALALRRLFRGVNPAVTYDLQASNRTRMYWRLFGRPVWNGSIDGCTYPHPENKLMQRRMSPVIRDLQLIAAAGVPVDLQASPVAELRHRLALPPITTTEKRKWIFAPYASSAAKRWPLPRFFDLAERLLQSGEDVTVLGGKDDVWESTPGAGAGQLRNLVGKTSLEELPAEIAGHTHFVGNDTGISHLCWMMGLRGAVLFGRSDWPGLQEFPAWAHCVAVNPPDAAALADGGMASISRDAVVNALEHL